MEFPDMPSANWGDKLPLLWHYIRWIISEYQVWIMIVVAFPITAALLEIPLEIISKARKKKNDDDDDYEIHKI